MMMFSNVHYVKIEKPTLCKVSCCHTNSCADSAFLELLAMNSTFL